ncbi:interferon-related developmental regulator 2 [Elysia marginata]|uniref:Interferon-related developmental regulator 2 n=1 Tax=Elysia marginata TaxID=1093978 RepID=A0AAV4H6Q5_9GAST|nr:interferon-related developmental regulator 2 [Elysia marginata]
MVGNRTRLLQILSPTHLSLSLSAPVMVATWEKLCFSDWQGDNWVTQNLASDGASWPESDPVTEDEARYTTVQENFEDKFIECLDGTLQKSANTRITSLQNIQRALQKKHVADFLWDRKETVTDNILRCLKKSKGNEQAVAAACLSLVALQLGPDAKSVFTSCQAYLTSLLADNTTSVIARGACAL